MDWKDTLASLTGLPEGDIPEEKEEKSKSCLPKGTLHVLMEKKGRGGKTATIIEGFEISDEEINEIAGILRKRLATGGSSRGGEILIQGDRRQEVAAILQEMGFKVKNSTSACKS